MKRNNNEIITRIHTRIDISVNEHTIERKIWFYRQKRLEFKVNEKVQTFHRIINTYASTHTIRKHRERPTERERARESPIHDDPHVWMTQMMMNYRNQISPCTHSATPDYSSTTFFQYSWAFKKQPWRTSTHRQCSSSLCTLPESIVSQPEERNPPRNRVESVQWSEEEQKDRVDGERDSDKIETYNLRYHNNPCNHENND